MFVPYKTKDDIIKWIKDYFAANGPDCNAVVGISGGKDSSVTAALCATALGAEKVYGVLMPQGDQHDIGYSRDLVSHLGIKNFTVNIKNTVDSLIKEIEQSGVSLNKQAVINIPARVRMTTLYAVSAAVNGRVANTCNLSEDHVGYSTKFGDSAGDFSPLSRLTASEVKILGMELSLPSKFTEKVPEDGLSGLSDEENLGFTYNVLDKYIREGVCEDISVKEKIDRLHKINMHKILLMPCFG
ncbi:MAG: NAD(+) synthase [Treponema sp.]|nr:NAD(+) synthase [Treponema sp.]MCL2236685.1 NAD(+) synthase [Treponema sp.]